MSSSKPQGQEQKYVFGTCIKPVTAWETRKLNTSASTYRNCMIQPSKSGPSFTIHNPALTLTFVLLKKRQAVLVVQAVDSPEDGQMLESNINNTEIVSGGILLLTI